MSKLRVGIVFGGRSTEHEVSIVSASTIFHGLDPDRHVPVLIGQNHDGVWHVAEAHRDLAPETLFASTDATRTFVSIREGLHFLGLDSGKDALDGPLDVVFPIIHGQGGEDGTLQAVFEMADLAYVGPGVASSALCMDKTLTKNVLRDHGIPTLPSVEAPRAEVLASSKALIDRAEVELGYPVFVKPTNTGSSVGVGKAEGPGELRTAIKEAARYDLDVMVEQGLDCREVECAVLGGTTPEASVLGEIRTTSRFYDYEAKYRSNTTELLIPAPVDPEVAEEIRELALRAFRALKCWGMARVDFFVERESGEVFLNELNTLPGFTGGSMYPLLWRASGVELPELIDRLLRLAIERQEARRSLAHRFDG